MPIPLPAAERHRLPPPLARALACAGVLLALAAAALLAGVRTGRAGADDTIATLETTASALELRIGHLEDEDQIEKLIDTYGYYLDKQQWDQLTDLFAEDGTMEISLRGVYVGKPSIRRALELFGPQNIEPEHLHNHIQLQPIITLSADGAHAWSRSRALSEIGTYGRTAIWGDGVYTNEYVKRDGVWRIAKDHIYTTFFASYDKGWKDGVGPAPKASSKIPPDAPPTELYDSFPGEYVAPFHFPHPVTGAQIEIPPQLQVRPNPGARP